MCGVYQFLMDNAHDGGEACPHVFMPDIVTLEMMGMQSAQESNQC